MRFSNLLAGALWFALPFNVLAVPFDFHNGFWTNLHHFLLQQSIETTEGDLLSPAEREAWKQTIHFYQVRFAGKDRLGREMESIKNSIEDHDSDPTLAGAGLDADFRAAIEQAAPAYRAHWWPEHSMVNAAWIAAAAPLVEKYGLMIMPRLAALYATPWPDAPIRVDVVWYGKDVTAYTTLFPTRTVIASGNPREGGLDGLEILYHEASHGLTARLQKAISDTARSEGKLLPRRDLWHALLFYTTGEVVTEAVAKDAPDYVPYATSRGLWERAWPGYPQIFEKDWKPWMKGDRGFDESVHRVVDAVLAGR